MSTGSCIPLAHLARELRALTGAEPPSYRAIYTRVVDARLPAVYRGGRWHVRREDLWEIAQLLGLRESQERRAPADTEAHASAGMATAA